MQAILYRLKNKGLKTFFRNLFCSSKLYLIRLKIIAPDIRRFAWYGVKIGKLLPLQDNKQIDFICLAAKANFKAIGSPPLNKKTMKTK